MVEKNIVRNGYDVIIAGHQPLDRKNTYHLIEKPLEGLVPATYHQEASAFVLAYDLSIGYAIGEIYRREEETITLGQLIALLEKVLFYKQQYFLDENHFYISESTIIYTFHEESLRLLYCPYYEGSFMESIFHLVGLLFKAEDWFQTYLDRVNQYTPYVTLENYYGLMSLLEDSLFEENKVETPLPFNMEPLYISDEKKDNHKKKYEMITIVLYLREKKKLWLLIPVLFSLGIILGFIL